jgi:hypothetical protein
MLLLVGACGDDAPASAPPSVPLATSEPAPVAAPIEPAPGAAPVEPARPPPPPLTLASIGHPCGEATRSDEASAANTAALVAHAAGDFATARDGFARASSLAPTWSTPRFNLACAHARLGDLDAAAEALEPALLRDLPETLGRLASDPDLAALREGEPTAGFRARVEEIRALHATAMRDGLPASCREEWGVYLRASDRFVALARGTAEFGALDLGRGRVGLMRAGIVGETETDEVYVLFSLSLEPLVPLTGAWSAGSRRHFEIPAGSGAMADPAELVRWIDVSSETARFAGGECGARWCVLDARETRAAESQAPAPGPREATPPEGFALDGDRLLVPGGEPIALGAGHAEAEWHTFAIDPSRRHVVVASDDVSEDETTYVVFEQSGELHRSVFDHVDLETRTVTRLGEGEDVAWTVADGPDCYTVLGHSVRRWPGFSATRHEELEMHGLVPQPRW